MNQDTLAKMEEIAGLIAGEFETNVDWPRVNFEYKGVRFCIDTKGKTGAFTFYALLPKVPYNVNVWEAEENWKQQKTKINESQDKDAQAIAERFKKRFLFGDLRKAYAMFSDAELSHELRKNAHEATVSKVVAIVQPIASRVRRLSDHESEISLYDFSECTGEITIRGDSVEFKIDVSSTEAISVISSVVATLR